MTPKPQKYTAPKPKKQPAAGIQSTAPIPHIVSTVAPKPKGETEEQKRHHALAAQVHEKGMDGKAAAEKGDFDTARACFQAQFALQRELLGPSDIHLISTLQSIMNCLIKEKDDTHVPAYMQQALQIYSNKGDTPAKNEIAKLKEPWKLWRGLGHSAAVCADVTRKALVPGADIAQTRAVITDYLRWSADFYSYAIKTYPGSQSDKEFADMANELQGVMTWIKHPLIRGQRERKAEDASWGKNKLYRGIRKW